MKYIDAWILETKSIADNDILKILDRRTRRTVIRRMPKPKKMEIIHPRNKWQSDLMIRNGFYFSDEELNTAEKHELGFIGIRNNVECYLTKVFN